MNLPRLCSGLGEDIKAEPIMAETMRNLYDGVPMDEVYKASVLAARGAANSRPDLATALALQLGGRCGVDHGIAMGLVLGPVLRFNLDAMGARGEQAASLLGQADLAEAIDRLRRHHGLPDSLSQLGVQGEDIAAIARLVQQHPAFRSNPRPIGEADVVQLLESAF